MHLVPHPSIMTNLAPIMIENGSIIRLQHKVTERRLHSHDFRPPVTEADWQNEVSAYGFPGFEGDANDLFRVEIVKSESNGDVASKRVRYSIHIIVPDNSAIDTKFRLIHYITGCALFSHKVKVFCPLDGLI